MSPIILMLLLMCLTALHQANGGYSFSRLTEREILSFGGSTRINWVTEGNMEFLNIQSSGYWQAGYWQSGSAADRMNALSFTIVKEPVWGTQLLSISEDIIGISVNGVAFYSPLMGGRNMVEGETKQNADNCGGYRQQDGTYRYYGLPIADFACPQSQAIYYTGSTEMVFLGVAMDGFPIYSEWAGLVPSSMDECGGTNLPEPDGRYAYIARREYPYLISCFRGRPITQLTTHPVCTPMHSTALHCAADKVEGRSYWKTFCDVTCWRDECSRACPDFTNTGQGGGMASWASAEELYGYFTCMKKLILPHICSIGDA